MMRPYTDFVEPIDQDIGGSDSEMGDVIRLSVAFSDPVTPRFLHFYPIRRTEANEGIASEPD